MIRQVLLLLVVVGVAARAGENYKETDAPLKVGVDQADANKAKANPADAGKPDAEKTQAKKPAAKPADVPAKPPTPEKLSFDQNKVMAQMAELEERMFRLAEALKALEPENSSRLRLAVKYAREELIQQQMKEIQQLLNTIKLDDATTEQKQLLVKLQRLQDLLLANDLSFQMQLERLRLIREIIKRLDGVIKEENREQKLSEETAGTQGKLARLEQGLATLKELIARQEGHVTTGAGLAEGGKAEAITGLRDDQSKTQKGTIALADAFKQAKEPKPLVEKASQEMGKAVAALPADAKTSDKALPAQREALRNLEAAQEQMEKDKADAEKQLARERFEAMKGDQTATRGRTDGILGMVRKLGDSGAGAANEIIRATGNMNSAEDELDKTRAAPAAGQQTRALESLKYARQQLSEEAERLLAALHGEVRRRVIEAILVMIEKQAAVRELTVTLAPRVQQGVRQAVASVVGLAQGEGEIIAVNNEILTLVEETEFGIALPAALRLVGRSMAIVQERLQAGDPTEPVVQREKRIEADLEALLNAMKQMPSSRQSDSKARRGNRERERELNRLIAELKMIRLLQLRVNDDTLDVDGKRAKEANTMSAVVQKAIQGLAEQQDDVRDTTERLSEQRGNELRPQP